MGAVFAIEKYVTLPVLAVGTNEFCVGEVLIWAVPAARRSAREKRDDGVPLDCVTTLF